MSKIIFNADDAISLAALVAGISETPRYFSENQRLIDEFVERMVTLERFQKSTSKTMFCTSFGLKSTGVEIDEETLLAIAVLLEFREETRGCGS